MDKSELVEIRAANTNDINFIMATFLRGLYHGDSWFSEVPKSIFMAHYKKFVEAMITSQNNVVVTACLKEDPEVILGYSVLSTSLTTAHWVFVKKAWRGIGIAKMLVPKSVTTVTHLTKTGVSLIRKKGLTFNPFLIT